MQDTASKMESKRKTFLLLLLLMAELFFCRSNVRCKILLNIQIFLLLHQNFFSSWELENFCLNFLGFELNLQVTYAASSVNLESPLANSEVVCRLATFILCSLLVITVLTSLASYFAAGERTHQKVFVICGYDFY